MRKVDQYFTRGGEVYEDYDCMLNQTNIGQNNNKFYVIQVIKSGSNFYTYNRWGFSPSLPSFLFLIKPFDSCFHPRFSFSLSFFSCLFLGRVGERGQDSVKNFTNADAAIKDFKDKFKSKTLNQWENRDSFVAKPGKYTLIEIDHEAEAEMQEKIAKLQKNEPQTTSKAVVKPCSLPKPTQDLMKLIFDKNMFESAMESFDLDIKKMPLGAISKSQIAKGYEVLVEIEEALKAGGRSRGGSIAELSSKFYTLIPHSFGRRVPPPLKSQEDVMKKMEMLNVTFLFLLQHFLFLIKAFFSSLSFFVSFFLNKNKGSWRYRNRPKSQRARGCQGRIRRAREPV